ncbi:Ethanolamine utilization cobalamin adenosyltransferase [Clostridium cavendishii DSM 21758]|uniref:Ethanolamine utilization cobalamin adenosyltransferase n=1 Tax=Clostridium cavendishii DSM 21758 TaxID=1121302 RepID=A0A1M6HNE1_9CLOT|nr:cobalamin adenosyltransferase [Clostridium cavendishii]SHJ23680.1 Ethanolamine utilization cobalamin adenosyltransferase [Clostridium cavendishii DSM 21758]
MKFITEEYLRTLYKKEPFSIYKLNHGERLTPGASQYLSDKRIKRLDDVSCNNDKVDEKNKSQTLPNKEREIKKLYCKLKSIEALFLVTSSEFIKEDVILAQSIIALKKRISNVRNFVDGKSTIEDSICKECKGIDLNNFYDDIDDCFEITEFHMQLEKSNQILKLNVLRCALREIEPIVFEIYGDDNMGEKIIKDVNSIINLLSQIICSTIGGEKCQRKV